MLFSLHSPFSPQIERHVRTWTWVFSHCRSQRAAQSRTEPHTARGCGTLQLAQREKRGAVYPQTSAGLWLKELKSNPPAWLALPVQQKKCPPLGDSSRSAKNKIGFLFYTLSDVNWRHFTCYLRTGTRGVQVGRRLDTGRRVTDHQEVTADLPRLVASLLHSAPLLSPLSCDRWCESGGRQSRTIPLPHHHRDWRREAHFGTELRPSARPPSAAPRPVTAERRSRCPPEGDPSRRGQLEGHIRGQCRAVTLGWSTSGRFWGQSVYGSSRRRRRADPSSAALRAMPV